jgi:hypothetical protein
VGAASLAAGAAATVAAGITILNAPGAAGITDTKHNTSCPPRPLKLAGSVDESLAGVGSMVSPCWSTKSSIGVLAGSGSSSSDSMQRSVILQKKLTKMDIRCAGDPLGVIFPYQAALQEGWPLGRGSNARVDQCSTSSKSFVVYTATEKQGEGSPNTVYSPSVLAPAVAAAAVTQESVLIPGCSKSVEQYVCSISYSNSRRFAYLTGLGSYLQSSDAQPGDLLLLEVCEQGLSLKGGSGTQARGLAGTTEQRAMSVGVGTEGGRSVPGEVGPCKYFVRLLRSSPGVGSS